MRRLYFSLTLIPMIVFTSLLLLIHIQPYDDSEYRAVLLPDGCPAPCFMGIRPGVTTVSEMQRILRTSGWISEIRMAPYARWMGVIWNEQAPAWFSNDNGGVGLLVAVKGRMVEEVHLTTNLPLAAVQLLLGKPSLKYVNVFRGMNGSQFTPMLNYAAAYPTRAMQVAVSEQCDGNARVSHDSANVVVRYYAAMETDSDVLQAFQSSTRDVRYTAC